MTKDYDADIHREADGWKREIYADEVAWVPPIEPRNQYVFQFPHADEFFICEFVYDDDEDVSSYPTHGPFDTLDEAKQALLAMARLTS